MMEDLLITIFTLPIICVTVYFVSMFTFHMTELGKENIYWLFIFPIKLSRLEYFDDTGWKYFRLSWYILPATAIASALFCVLIKIIFYAA